jgi:hypothetical protein
MISGNRRDAGRPAAVLDRLDPTQNLLGVRLADGEGSHVSCIDPNQPMLHGWAGAPVDNVSELWLGSLAEGGIPLIRRWQPR